ncbi:MAG: hypothetical protein NXI32_23605 [bacterium]|nr:hypothetical protein [bacterium]
MCPDKKSLDYRGIAAICFGGYASILLAGSFVVVWNNWVPGFNGLGKFLFFSYPVSVLIALVLSVFGVGFSGGWKSWVGLVLALANILAAYLFILEAMGRMT